MPAMNLQIWVGDLTIDFKIDFGPSIANFIRVDKMWEGEAFSMEIRKMI